MRSIMTFTSYLKRRRTLLLSNIQIIPIICKKCKKDAAKQISAGTKKTQARNAEPCRAETSTRPRDMPAPVLAAWSPDTAAMSRASYTPPNPELAALFKLHGASGADIDQMCRKLCETAGCYTVQHFP